MYFEEIKGMKIPVLTRPYGSEYTDPCVYCGANHSHAPGEGPKRVHCSDSRDGRSPGPIELSDGSLAYPRKQGYFLKYR